MGDERSGQQHHERIRDQSVKLVATLSGTTGIGQKVVLGKPNVKGYS
jgi:hypothetical protein